jgi:hypothetical protein
LDHFKTAGLLTAFLLAGIPGSAQSVSTLMGGRGAGLAYASSTLHDEWSLLNNVGGLAKVTQPNTSFSYEVRPGLTGANRMAAVVASPLKTGVAGFGLFRFGDDLYSEQVITSGYSNQLGLASLGLKVNYIQYKNGFGIHHAVSLNFGGLAQLTPQIAVGAYIINLNQPKLSSSDNRLPTRLAAGLAFQPKGMVLLLVEVEKDLDYPMTIKGGLEYTLYKRIDFRTGFNLNPNSIFFGLGFLIRKIKIDYAFQYTTSLGAAHQSSAIYRFGKAPKTR